MGSNKAKAPPPTPPLQQQQKQQQTMRRALLPPAAPAAQSPFFDNTTLDLAQKSSVYRVVPERPQRPGTELLWGALACRAQPAAVRAVRCVLAMVANTKTRQKHIGVAKKRITYRVVGGEPNVVVVWYTCRAQSAACRRSLCFGHGRMLAKAKKRHRALSLTTPPSIWRKNRQFTVLYRKGHKDQAQSCCGVHSPVARSLLPFVQFVVCWPWWQTQKHGRNTLVWQKTISVPCCTGKELCGGGGSRMLLLCGTLVAGSQQPAAVRCVLAMVECWQKQKKAATHAPMCFCHPPDQKHCRCHQHRHGQGNRKKITNPQIALL